MVIYGTRAVHLKSVQSRATTCENCGTQGSIVLSVYRKHAHIFWIPTFPIGKKGISQCGQCKNMLETKDMPERLKKEYLNLKADAKGPIWQFTGLGIIVALISWGVYTNNENKKLELQYLASPEVGDVYEFKTESGGYSTSKLIDISEDSIFLSDNKYEINKVSKIYEIDKPENYSESSYGISKGELKNWHDSGNVIDINR